jgi:hypothetical protein
MKIGAHPLRIRAVAFSALAFAAGNPHAALKSVLHYTKTGYFSFPYGVQGCTAALNELGAEHHFTVKHSQDPDDLLRLDAFDLVIYDNNTDAGGVNNVLTPPQEALMRYMNAGGRFLAFHGAADHRGQWTWYDTALFSGARFKEFDPGARANLYWSSKPKSTTDLELHYLRKYFLDSMGIPADSVPIRTAIMHFNIDVADSPGVMAIQELRGGSARNGVRETFTWAKRFPKGGRMLYTALGHEINDWTDNGAWLKKATYAYMRYLMGEFYVDGVVASPEIHARGPRLEVLSREGGNVRITDVRGKVVASGGGGAAERFSLGQGVYIVTVKSPGAAKSRLIAVP